MEHIGISVIVPIYNTKPYLKECVDSILKQEVEVPFEVLLVDDGATDGCAEMCDEFAAKDKRVRVFHQENQGLSAARNTGIDAARGRYYAFVDSDDVVCPGYLHTLYAACEKNDAYMALCSVEDVQENGKSCDPASYTRPNAEGVFCGKDLLNEFYTPNGTVYTVAWNKLYRADIVREHPDVRCNEELDYSEDLYFNLSFIRYAQQFYALSTPIYNYVQNPDSAVHHLNPFDVLTTRFELTTYYKDLFKHIGLYEENKYRLNKFFFGVAES